MLLAGIGFDGAYVASSQDGLIKNLIQVMETHVLLCSLI